MKYLSDAIATCIFPIAKAALCCLCHTAWLLVGLREFLAMKRAQKRLSHRDSFLPAC